MTSHSDDLRGRPAPLAGPEPSGGAGTTPRARTSHRGCEAAEAVELWGGPCDGRVVPRARFFRSPAPFLPEGSRLPAYYALVPGQNRALYAGREAPE